MTIDITAHLRRLVLAGLPVLGGACQPGAAPAHPTPPGPPGASSLPADVRCQARTIIAEQFTNGDRRKIAIGFDDKNVRVADLYHSCIATGDYCKRLCAEILASGVPVPSGFSSSGPLSCDLGCDSTGRAVARLSYVHASMAAVGRRPEGFADAVGDEDDARVAAFFRGCAQLEGASIAAFQILAAELEHHGAPPSLVERAQAAARDEARHFKLTARLARRFGAEGRVRCPRITRRPPRDLLDVALENATEGCVSETFAAAVALHQAATAADPDVRAIMAVIAEDELRHAQLAWDVHAWAEESLDRTANDQIAAARAATARRLRAEAGRPVPTELVVHAGMPEPGTAIRMAAAASTLWS